MTPDARLERDIDRARTQFEFARTAEERTRWLHTLEALIARRSPQQVKKMERERGLG